MNPSNDTPTTFAALGVPADLVDALDAQGFAAPFAIQAATIPAALAGDDVSGRAPTGSGKTVAFGVPLVATVQRARPKRPRALVLVPTRELAAQVSKDLTWLGAGRDVRVHAFYGGTKFQPQIAALRRGVDIAVACPGRLADLINQGLVRLDGVDLVVVDEADRMADMGFLPEVRRLIDQTDADRQTLLFSATLDGDVDELVRRYQNDPVTVDVTPDIPEANLEHHFWSVAHAERVPVTAAVVDRVGPTVVFTRTRYGADRVARQLGRAGVEAVAIHGNRTQNQRERALQAFRSGRARALVATDVAARGIHVDDVAGVVHFDLPADPKDFIHRSGRTGRAGATGTVVALAMPDRKSDTRKLLRGLELDATVGPVDLEALPVGAPAPSRPSGQGTGAAPRRKPRPSGRRGGKPQGRSSFEPESPKSKSSKPKSTKPKSAKAGGSGSKKSGSQKPSSKHGAPKARRPKTKGPKSTGAKHTSSRRGGPGKGGAGKRGAGRPGNSSRNGTGRPPRNGSGRVQASRGPTRSAPVR